MNNSWKNKSKQTSPGFVYFKSNQSQQSDTSSDTADFLSFSENSPSCASPPSRRFSPSIYSSPQGKMYNYQSPRNRSYHNSYYPNNAPNDSNSHHRHYGYSHNKSWRKNNSYGKNHNSSFDESRDNKNQNNTSKYYDPTCLQDPWQELEDQLKVQETISKSQIANPNSEDSSSEDSSEEESSPSLSSEDKEA